MASRRTTRASARAGSMGPPPPTPITRSRASVAPGDNESITSRRSTRSRSKVTTSGTNAYGTNAPDALTNPLGFQTTQTQAVNTFSDALDQAVTRRPRAAGSVLGFSDLGYLSNAELNEINNPQQALDTRLNTLAPNTPALDTPALDTPVLDTPAPNTPAPGRFRVFTYAGKWLLGGNRPATNANIAPANDQSATDFLHPQQGDPNSLGDLGPGANAQTNQPRAILPFPSTRFPSIPFRMSLLKRIMYIIFSVVAVATAVYVVYICSVSALAQNPDIFHFRLSAPSATSQTPKCPECPMNDDRQAKISDQRLDTLEGKYVKLEEVVYNQPRPQLDYFAPQNDAVVIPKFTSPEKKRKVAGFLGLFKNEVGLKKDPKIIGPFKDPQKMWCAPSDRGKAQITVRMAAAISPNKIQIQQSFSMEASLNADTYPKEFELWVDIEDDHKREAILARVLRSYPDILDRDESQKGRKLSPAQTLPATFVPIGRWHYGIFDKYAARETFEINTRLDNFNASTTTAAVRINSNWGNAEAICLHQVSLFGRQISPPVKYYASPAPDEILAYSPSA